MDRIMAHCNFMDQYHADNGSLILPSSHQRVLPKSVDSRQQCALAGYQPHGLEPQRGGGLLHNGALDDKPLVAACSRRGHACQVLPLGAQDLLWRKRQAISV